MKKTIRTLTVMVMAILLLTIATIPALATGFDFKTAIDNFTESSLNTRILKVGETNSPLGANWLSIPEAQCYISDTNVITVDSNGVVTAVGEGTAYIAIVPNATTYEITCYKVSNKASNNNTPLVSGSQDLLNNSDVFGLNSMIFGMFTVVSVGGILVAAFFVFVVILIIRKSRKGNSNHTDENAEEKWREFGALGEDHVWEKLKKLQECDVYRNVRVRNGGVSSEIDAIIVDAIKGIFLIETKSNGGKYLLKGEKAKTVTYAMLDKDHSDQIAKHNKDFKNHFDNLQIEDKVTDVLVFSWPENDVRRVLAKETFPQTEYDVITVEQLGEFLRAQSDNPLTNQQRNTIAARLKSCSEDWIIR